MRLLVECDLDVDLKAMIATAVEVQPQSKIDSEENCAALYSFISERLRRYFLDRDAGPMTSSKN